MNETAIPVAEAAKDVLKLPDLVERQRESAVLTREGKPVAIINPVPAPALTGAELAERWRKMEKLPPEEANPLADDLEAARRHLPPLKSAWA
jgi:antitoxin (DNA-binding transcriptional repressor) of toxin-antitoxin stability system